MFKDDFQTAIDKDQSNTLPVSSFQVDDLMEKLKLLGYEKQLLKEMKMKPLSRFYFLRSFNPGEQFYMFTSLCCWLIRKTGKSFEQPQEFDDPSATITKILKVLQDMDIPTDFPSNKLMQGAGPICVFVLDCLATQAFRIDKAQLERPDMKGQDDETPAEIFENDAEIILEKVEEEQNALFGSDDDSDDARNSMLDLNMSGSAGKQKGGNNGKREEFKFDTMSDAEDWRLELERVLPQLKVVIKTDPRDWRAHLEQMKSLRTSIDSATDDTKSQLRKLQTDVAFAMEKIESREKHLNNDLANYVQQYKNISTEYNQVMQSIKEADVEKVTMEQELARVTNEFENVKAQMELRGNTMSDGSPLINIKKAIAKIKEEIIEMDVEIGVMQHTLDQDILKQSEMFSEMFESSVFQ